MLTIETSKTPETQQTQNPQDNARQVTDLACLNFVDYTINSTLLKQDAIFPWILSVS
ncbi:MAG: hypothetical protein Hens3KO_13840 [Henriciella sp.]